MTGRRGTPGNVDGAPHVRTMPRNLHAEEVEALPRTTDMSEGYRITNERDDSCIWLF